MTRPETGYQLECADRVLAAALRRWLDESGLTWPGPFSIRARIVAALEPLEDRRESFPQEGIEIRAGPPDGTVRIRWTEVPAEALVHRDAASVELALTPAAVEQFEVAERGFLLVALLFVLRRLGWYHVHGAALVDREGRGWMLVGNSCTGKSTTAALLATRGWAVGTDDIAFLETGGPAVAVHGFRSPIALRKGGRDLLSDLVGVSSAGLDLTRRRKTGFWPDELGGRWADVVIPEILLFPTIGDRTSVEPMRPAEMLSGLVTWSVWVLYETLHAQEHLDVLRKLAAQARGYRATFGPDLFENPLLLQDLIA